KLLFWRCLFSLDSNILLISDMSESCKCIHIPCLSSLYQHVPGPVLAEVAVSVFSFVKDSYPINPALFEEFENNDGYAVLQTIMARCEEETAHEDFSSVKDLLCLIASFTLFGKAELKVALCVNNPQPPGFKFDPSLTKGSTVKNLRAFKIIQASFLRSGSALTCSQILRTVQMIWSWDKANFFLLEWTLQCLAQFAECVWQKPATVHRLFFELVEMVVFHLSYIPHDTLKKVQAMLKEGSSQAFSMAALECFHGLVMRSGLLSEVLIDGGLMELLLVELRRRAKILRKAGITGEAHVCVSWVEDCERQLTTNMLNVVSALAMRSVRNTACIRDLGMIPYIKIFLNDEQFRSPALCILEQLSEMNPEEYMSTAIGALCSSTENELRFKLDVLQSILKVLDNPNSWNAFRTAGGFNGLLSIVVDMEGALLEQPLGVWASVSHSSLMELLLLTLHVVALVVHLHPVNAHFFHTTGHYEKLAEALLQLGCFHDSVHMKADVATEFSCEHTILHPGAVKVMMILVPHIYFPSDPQMSAELQLAVTGHVQSMVKSEQNRQIMCESGLLVTLLTHCKSILSNSGHLLHLPVVRILEKLASQSIDHKCLRLVQVTEFVFYGTAKKTHKKSLKRTFSLLWTSPKSRIPIPLHRIISLVSMTSPRSFRPHKVSVSPSFAEFDMTDSGYGCLFLPSLATVKGVSADCISTGGTSSGEKYCRGFPPSAGLSFSCWFLISRFSSACDSHPVRLLTVVRHMSRAEQQYCCLSVSISASDGCLVISTEEEPYQFLGDDSACIHLRFKCSKQLMPGQWHHLVVAMAKDIKKSCKVSAYLNGEVIGTSKMRYIQPFPGQCIAMDASAVIDVCGIIGTPPIWKQHAALIWRVGPAYLFEEVLSADSVEIMYAQGTKYIGNYLALDVQGRLIPPERISFGINPAVFTVTTVAEIRDQYNEVDCRLIAKEMGITSRDNSTPVFLARNISQHLSGTARTIGAALVGRFAVRTFTSNSAATSFQYVGGPAVVLSLVAMASDDGSLYASIKVLLSILDTNQVMRREMKRINGYKLFAFLLKMKAHLISSRTFQLILAIVGAMELTTGCIYIHDLTAPESLDLSVLNHFVEILKSSSGDPQNAETMHSLDLMAKLLFLLQDPSVTHRKVTVICTIVKYLLQGHFSTADVRRHGKIIMFEALFLIYILCLYFCLALSQTPARTVWIRNQLLEVLSSLIICDSPLPNNNQEEVFLTLGSDWFLLFLQGHTHSSTVLLIIRLLIHFLSNQSILTKFRDGVSPGTLVESMEMPQDVIGHLGLHSWSFECLSCTCPGFTVLPRLLLSHISSPQIYGAFAALLMGKADFHIPNGQVSFNFSFCNSSYRCTDTVQKIGQIFVSDVCVFVFFVVVVCAVESELMKLVENIWSKVMLERRQSLEEAYKIDLSAKQAGREVPVSMTDVSPLWEETAEKAWQVFIGRSVSLLCTLLLHCCCVLVSINAHLPPFKITLTRFMYLRTLCEPGREAEEEPGSDCERLTFFPTLTEASAPVEDLHSEQCAETQLILQQLAANEEVRQCVAVVSGHMLTEGVLLYGKTDLYICEGFTLTSSGDVCCGTHHPTSVRDSFISEMLKKEQSSVNPACRRWPYADIKEARFMRFLLEVGLYSTVSLPFVYHLYIICISIYNFEYLMHLNTLAGRTYNDLMQYPVFPWVLADYESETLDLSSSTTFRDLSRPMGAQTEKRREKFIERYNEVDSNDGDLSAQCHYCTHYSSAIIVASYLVRMEPFSQTFLSLQGGSFDVPERMFHSVQREWESASRDNMSDVRELIPEFYYLPDFLVNSNNFEFGRMQDGTSLGDVVLPPWAKGDPQEFIRMHREALESDYVSANLHLWIDLIFGYRQQGPAAVEALNTFHPYFYTDRHDAESMKNPLKKSTVLGYVSNFGQIPKQLFTKPHPNRAAHKSSASKEASGANHVTPFFFRLDKLKPSAQPIKAAMKNNAASLWILAELMHGSVGQIVCGEKDVLVVEKNKLLMPPHWNTYFCWGYYDNTCSFGNYTTEKGFAVWEGLSDWGETVCAACPNSNTLITAGSSTVVCVWDVSISKDKLKHMNLKQALYGHTDTVTCVVASEAHSVIISGSQDQTCILWDLEELSYITQLPTHSSSVSALAINDLTGEIVSCSGTHLYLWTMKGQLLASVNTPYVAEGSIQCCCFTQKCEWDSRNVIIAGYADGIVRVRALEYELCTFSCSRNQNTRYLSKLLLANQIILYLLLSVMAQTLSRKFDSEGSREKFIIVHCLCKALGLAARNYGAKLLNIQPVNTDEQFR
uniref:WDFY family member 4 n=1 Tax=Astyanax mexicanus TaxID=7994 RepID=A0A8B9LHN3_ASTMX